MGGRVALTVRLSEDEQWRGSCWTNLLPIGLFAPEFYVDLESSRRHSWQFVQGLLENRRLEPVLEQMWGGHHMCAPTGYGIVIVDYVSRSLVSAQGYSFAHRANLFDFERDDSDRLGKWRALEAADLLEDVKEHPGVGLLEANIRLPFEHSRSGLEDLIDEAMADWADATLGLSEEERAAWTAWIAGGDE